MFYLLKISLSVVGSDFEVFIIHDTQHTTKSLIAK